MTHRILPFLIGTGTVAIAYGSLRDDIFQQQRTIRAKLTNNDNISDSPSKLLILSELDNHRLSLFQRISNEWNQSVLDVYQAFAGDRPNQMFQRIAQCAGATAATVAGCAALSSQVYNTKALEIKQRGYTTLPLFLSEDERQVLLRHTRRQPLLNPTEIAGLPPCAEPTKGRFHCELTNTFHRYWSRSDDLAVSDIKSTVLAVESRAKQFAHVFFNPPLPGVSGVAGVAGVATKNIRFRMTQLQLLDSKAQSQVQFWHVDNTSRGLTFVVALEDIHEEHGPTELMTSTQTMHAPTDGEFQINHCCTTVTQALACTRGSNDGQQGEDQPLKIVRVQKATLAKKEAFVFDSRTWHRGGANMSDTSRPVLIIRYDLSDCTPPGMGVVGTSLIRFVGWLIEDAVAREHGK